MRAEDSVIGTVRLRRDEAFLGAQAAPIVRPDRTPDPVAAMARLTGVAGADLIGTRPALAATAIEGNDEREFRLFEALFGRDALFIARFGQHRWPQLPRATFMALAELQGLPRDLAPEPKLYDRRLERPGRIPHETRTDDDPIAQYLVNELGWAFPYYHSDDATPMFVRDLARAALGDASVLTERVVQRDGAERTLLDALRAGLDHVRRSIGAEDLLVSRRAPGDPLGGLHAYPVWQDSPDAHFFRNGDIAHGPVAMFEVQTYVHDAFLTLAELVDRHELLAPYLGSADVLRAQARSIADAVLTRFWNPEGYFAPGVSNVGGGLVALGGRKSTMGAALDSELLVGDARRPYVDALVHTMLSVDGGMVTPWGIRTLGAVDDCDHYRPDAYHNGNIWLFDNHVIAGGLRRHGLHGLASWLDENIVRACNTLAMYPEFIRGDSVDRPLVTDYTVDVMALHPDGHRFKNRIAQPPQLVQGWTLASYIDATHELHRHPTRATDPELRRQEVALLADLGPRAAARTVDGPVLERSAPKR